MFPNRGKDPKEQVNTLFDSVPPHLYTTVWFDIEMNPSPGGSWDNHTPESNCEYLAELLKAVRDGGKNVGVYTSLRQWKKIMGEAICPEADKIPLWYARFDNKPDFSDFKPFAGWEKPYMKQFAGDIKVCQANVDKNWRP